MSCFTGAYPEQKAAYKHLFAYGFIYQQIAPQKNMKIVENLMGKTINFAGVKMDASGSPKTLSSSPVFDNL